MLQNFQLHVMAKWFVVVVEQIKKQGQEEDPQPFWLPLTSLEGCEQGGQCFREEAREDRQKEYLTDAGLQC